jgi:hypothetical protein
MPSSKGRPVAAKTAYSDDAAVVEHARNASVAIGSDVRGTRAHETLAAVDANDLRASMQPRLRSASC